eukprot:TRINITY_DN3344_c0_g2_i1.p1 TRINITY_DN3344_c0_g2~~TRINITY_DN3344_c0_g2_i1.p1  ORF type:complete len:454 (-),score=81.41 TRINITY_DN3344_c0_g2_i1:218-1579(-)
MYWKSGESLKSDLWDNYSVSWEWGFLPPTQPLSKLTNPYFSPWEQIMSALPQLLREKTFQDQIDQTLPLLDAEQLQGREEYVRALTVLSFLSSAYVWMNYPIPKTKLPANISVPFKKVCGYFDLPPILTYTGFTLFNWKIVDPNLPFSIDNITVPTTFTETESERWFSIIPLGVEKVAVNSIQQIILAQTKIEEITNCHNDVHGRIHVYQNNTLMEDNINFGSSQLSPRDERQLLIEHMERELLVYLTRLDDSIQQITKIVNRMYEKCNPDTFYTVLRPFLSGWKGSPHLPLGLIYDGLSEEPLQFHGSSAAQSSVFALLDAALGVNHHPEEKIQLGGSQTTQSISGGAHNFLEHMKLYMPRKHREFIARVQQSPFSIHHYVEDSAILKDELRASFNRCVESLSDFRKAHMGLAVHYVVARARQQGHSARGTGGSDVVSILKKLRAETDQTKI